MANQIATAAVNHAAIEAPTLILGKSSNNQVQCSKCKAVYGQGQKHTCK